MNYEPNTIDWKKGDFVLHDADAKEQRMLMVITGYDKKKDLYESRYVFQEQIVGDRKVYLNDKKLLHDPKRFDIRLPTKKELRDHIVHVQSHAYHVLGCMNITLKSFCPCHECGYWNGVICESENPENEHGDMYQIVQGRWEIKKFNIPKEDIQLPIIETTTATPKEYKTMLKCKGCGKEFDEVPKWKEGECPEDEFSHHFEIIRTDIPNEMYDQVFKGKDITAIKEIKGWLIEQIEYSKFCLDKCKIGSKEEGYFLQKISFYNNVLDKVMKIKAEEGSG